VQRALRFLVADDHPVNRLLVRQVLSRQWPHSAVVEAEDGQAAVQALMQGPAFDLVLMDMVMPVMDGIEATRKIKASELRAVRSTPVLGLTANVSTTDLERFKAAGLGGLLLKPFDVAQLRAEVLRLMADRLQEEAVP
jgi:CheY-like chemotaxis protein